jgi:hypothetical protein
MIWAELKSRFIVGYDSSPKLADLLCQSNPIGIMGNAFKKDGY